MSKLQKEQLIKLNWSNRSECDYDDYRLRRYLSQVFWKENITIDILTNNFRTFFIFFQFLAATVKMMLIFQFGLCISFMGIVNAALSGNSNEHNKNEILKMSPVQSSWVGSVIYICQPIGSIISAITTGKSETSINLIQIYFVHLF